MTRHLAPSLIALMLVLIVVNGAMAPDPLLISPTSHGKAPYGYGAAHDLLGELGLLSGRTRRLPDAAERNVARWLVMPSFLAKEGAHDIDWASAAADTDADALLAWVEQGGTAIVFGASHSNWQRLGLELLVMDRADVLDGEGVAAPDGDDGSPLDDQGGGETGSAANGDASGDERKRWYDLIGYLHNAPISLLAPADDWPARRLQLYEPVRFEAVDPEAFALHYRIGDAPFLVEKAVGAGRIVAIADARVLQNATFDRADHSVLCADLARRYGRALFDERSHGLLPADNLVVALGAGPALCLGVGLAGLMLCLIWWLRREPPRSAHDSPPHQPHLDAYVHDLALAYQHRGVREAGPAFEAYRLGFRQRLRRSLFGRGRGDDSQLTRRIEADASMTAYLRAALSGRVQARDRQQLLQLCRALEAHAARVLKPAERS